MLSNIVFAIICWHERHRYLLHWMHSSLITFWLTFGSFWLWLIVFVPVICLNHVFLHKPMTGVALNTFLNVLLICNICQRLLIISLIFGKVGLYVTENGIMFFWYWINLFDRIYLSRLSTFSILVLNDVFFVPFFHELFNQVIWMLFVFIKSWANTFYS